MAIGMRAMAAALRRGGVSPLVGSRRLTIALNAVPSPMTANVIVIDTLACLGLGSSGPATNGRNAATKSTRA